MVFTLSRSSQTAEEGASSALVRRGAGQGGGHSWTAARGRKGTGCECLAAPKGGGLLHPITVCWGVLCSNLNFVLACS